MRRQQNGIVAVVVAIALLALLVMAGLAIDTGHLVLNKSRLQSTMDASALAAAKVLDQTHSETQATAAARSVFDLNAAQHAELRDKMSGADITVQYSSTLNPFAPGTSPAEYVRVISPSFSMWTSFTQLLGFMEMTTGASAVAGPSAPIPRPCDLFPIAVCGDPAHLDAYPWGFAPYPDPASTVTGLKLASGAAGTTFGPGNFQLIRLGGSGGADVRRNMAGGAACAGDMVEVDPQPGNVIGPVAQGLNTRFGQYQGPFGGERSDYPSDWFTSPSPGTPFDVDAATQAITFNGVPVTGNVDEISGAYTYADYLADIDSVVPGNEPAGVPQRRVVTIPIVDCRNTVPGTSATLPVAGFACFFILQPMRQSGTEGWIFGQFIEECPATGAPGPVPGFGPYKIVLHNDPDSPDS